MIRRLPTRNASGTSTKASVTPVKWLAEGAPLSDGRLAGLATGQPQELQGYYQGVSPEALVPYRSPAPKTVATASPSSSRR
jgi:hypothetical protein